MANFANNDATGMFTINAKKAEVDWNDTLSGVLLPPPRSLSASSVIRCCSAAILHDSFVLRVGAYVLCQQKQNDPICVGRVDEILADANAKRLIGLLIQEYKIGEAVLPYRFPVMTPSPHPPKLYSIKVSTNYDIMLYQYT